MATYNLRALVLTLTAMVGPVWSMPNKRDFVPTVQSAQSVGIMADPNLNRDSCGSLRIGDRMLWTCRDTQHYGSDGKGTLPIWASSASWSNLNGGSPDVFMYSTSSTVPYFPYASDECSSNTAGDCGDGTRFAIWPNTPPVVTTMNGNSVTAYTWLKKSHTGPGLNVVTKDPATTLYKTVYDTGSTDRNKLPKQQMVQESFWAENGIPYGDYGTVVKDGMVYLWGQTYSKVVGLARVSANSVEDKSKYEYYVNGAWTSQMPGMNDSGVNIPNASAGGQGTYFYSYYWSKWVWIGQNGFSIEADFFITTADSPEGPWADSVLFYQGEKGTAALPDYTLQAHPGISQSGLADTNVLYISYTKQDDVFTTPLVKITWA